MCFEKLSIKATGSIYVKHNTLINAACPQFIILFGALNSHMFWKAVHLVKKKQNKNKEEEEEE